MSGAETIASELQEMGDKLLVQGEEEEAGPPAGMRWMMEWWRQGSPIA